MLKNREKLLFKLGLGFLIVYIPSKLLANDYTFFNILEVISGVAFLAIAIILVAIKTGKNNGDIDHNNKFTSWTALIKHLSISSVPFLLIIFGLMAQEVVR